MGFDIFEDDGTSFMSYFIKMHVEFDDVSMYLSLSPTI